MTKETNSKKEIQEGKVFALMGYLFVLCIIPLVFKKDNQFALFHAKQGLVIFVAEVATLIISVIPRIGTLILTFGILLLGLLSLWGIIQSLSGKYTKLAVIFGLAEKISL